MMNIFITFYLKYFPSTFNAEYKIWVYHRNFDEISNVRGCYGL